MSTIKKLAYLIASLLIVMVVYWGVIIPMNGRKFSSNTSVLFKLYFRNNLVEDFPILNPKSKPKYELHSSSSQFAQGWEVQYQSKYDKCILLRDFSKYLIDNKCEVIKPSEPGCNWKSIDTNAYNSIHVIKGHTTSKLFELRILTNKDVSEIDFLMVE
jgi:hypothetical protein